MKKTKQKNANDCTQKQSNKFTSQKAITLIALVITIIVMLILVTVTITLAINGGLIGQAQRAISKTDEAKLNEIEYLSNGKVRIDGVEYNSIDEYLNGATGEQSTGEQATGEQSTPAEDVGIGTDGQPVDLSLWEYRISKGTAGPYNLTGYKGSIVDGQIQGTVPATINGERINMMSGTFSGNTDLTTMPDIPNTVMSMEGVFSGCTNITGTITITNSSCGSGTDCFFGVTNNITVRVPTGSYAYNTFYEAYGSTPNITIEQY